jgi:hypothetical protein
MTHPTAHLISATYIFADMVNDDLSPRSSSYFLNVFSYSYAHMINKKENS